LSKEGSPSLLPFFLLGTQEWPRRESRPAEGKESERTMVIKQVEEEKRQWRNEYQSNGEDGDS
jgi:hypothetical protein